MDLKMFDINELLTNERKKFTEELLKNTIISNDKLKIKELEDKLALIFVEVEKIIKNNPTSSLQYVYDTIIKNFFNKIELITQNTPGLSVGIKDNITNGELYIYQGKTTTNDEAKKIDEDTRFDLASVTKLFTAIELLKKQEAGKLDLQKSINHYTDKYINLQNVSLEDAAKFYYQINTDGRLDSVDSKEQLLSNLYNSKVVDSNTFVYSDIPYIILGEILRDTGDEFSKYFNEELGMLKTSYDVRNKIITGSDYSRLDQIHDMKAQKMKEFNLGNPGHAGVYSTSEDLVKLGANILDDKFLTKESKKILTTPSRGEYKYFNKKTESIADKNRAMGVYIQTEKGISHSDIAIHTSKEAIAASGTTGPYVLMDPTNNYTFNYLCNPYSKEEGNAKIMVNGEEKRWAGASNIIKEELVNLVYELRFARNVFKTISLINDVNKEIEHVFENKHVIKR